MSQMYKYASLYTFTVWQKSDKFLSLALGTPGTILSCRYQQHRWLLPLGLHAQCQAQSQKFEWLLDECPSGTKPILVENCKPRSKRLLWQWKQQVLNKSIIGSPTFLSSFPYIFFCPFRNNPVASVSSFTLNISLVRCRCVPVDQDIWWTEAE